MQFGYGNEEGNKKSILRGKVAITLGLVGAFVLLVGPLVLVQIPQRAADGRVPAYPTNEVYDQELFHLPVIRKIAESPLGEVDWFELNVPMIPGFHAGLAWVYTVSGGSIRALQLTNCLVSLGLIVLQFWVLAKYVSPGTATALAAPLLLSTYFLGSAAWVVTDNFGLFFAASCLAVLFHFRSDSQLVGAAVLATLAVVARQFYVWLLVPLFVTGISLRSRSMASAENAVQKGLGAGPRMLLLVASLMLPVVPVAVFAVGWGGLVPPAFRSFHSGHVSPTALPFALALTCCLGLPILLFSHGTVRCLIPHGRVEVAALIVSTCVAVCLPTAYSVEGGRWGGALWELVRITPTVHQRSLVLTALAPLGVLVLAKLVFGLETAEAKRRGSVALAAMCGLIVVTVGSAVVFQRYLEPQILIVLSFMAATVSNGRITLRRFVFLLPLLVWQGFTYIVTTLGPAITR